ncbi:MAG TPA: cysteine dioxygenase family protein [Chloroflexota bacterium]|jgi:predicted metal-dependent enzyme (double-stranded beta helix superfamily)
MLTPPLQEFVRTVDLLVGRELPQPTLLAELTPEFRRVLAEPALLDPRHCCPPAGSYVQHTLHGDPAGRFSLVALVWRPCSATPIHDHHAWGLAGVYRGRELETRFVWCDRSGTTPGLRAEEKREACAGEVLPIVPPSDIHRVLSPGPLPTISLHLYGLDVAALPGRSSVRCVYPADLLVTPGRGAPALAS